MLREFLHNIQTRGLFWYLWTCWIVLIIPMVPDFVRSLVAMPYGGGSGGFLMASLFCFCGPIIVPLYTMHVVSTWLTTLTAAMTEEMALWMLKIVVGVTLSYLGLFVWEQLHAFRHSEAGRMYWRWFVVYLFATWTLYLLTLTGLTPLAPLHLPLYVLSLLTACLAIADGSAKLGAHMHPLLTLAILMIKFAVSYGACWVLMSLWEWQRAIPGRPTSDMIDEKGSQSGNRGGRV